MTQGMTTREEANVTDAVELFAGPGGYSEGFRMARPDLNMRGLELDQMAVRTAICAGHDRILADVTKEDPRDHWSDTAKLLHASPVCKGFSLAGKGLGRRDGEALISVIRAAASDRSDVPGMIALASRHASDPRSALTLEPLRWIEALRPTYVTLEQTPAVLRIWDAYRDTLGNWGYAAWSGILHSEQFGVPQTRRRAFLIARLDGQPASPPPVTHSRYHIRTPERLDPGVQPWVSMAEALGWGMIARPSMTVTSGGTNTGGAEPFGNGARKGMLRERDAGRWSDFSWEDRVNNQSGTEFDKEWPFKRPAPTVAGREIVTMPGANANRFNGATKSRNDGLRVSVEEAAVLQSFPWRYPWQGTKGQRHEQVGNAVPPLLAAAVVEHLLPKGE